MKPTCTTYEDGSRHWYINGELHREDGPAVEHADGSKWWYFHDELHRVDGPAIEFADGTKYWYRHGNCHREDGPAIDDTYGTKEWYLNGIEYSFKEYLAQLTNQDVIDRLLAMHALDGAML